MCDKTGKVMQLLIGYCFCSPILSGLLSKGGSLFLRTMEIMVLFFSCTFLRVMPMGMIFRLFSFLTVCTELFLLWVLRASASRLLLDYWEVIKSILEWGTPLPLVDLFIPEACVKDFLMH